MYYENFVIIMFSHTPDYTFSGSLLTLIICIIVISANPLKINTTQSNFQYDYSTADFSANLNEEIDR